MFLISLYKVLYCLQTTSIQTYIFYVLLSEVHTYINAYNMHFNHVLPKSTSYITYIL